MECYVVVVFVEDIDWEWIVFFYEVLGRFVFLLVVEFNCVVVVVMVMGLVFVLFIVDWLFDLGVFCGYYLLLVMCGELL